MRGKDTAEGIVRASEHANVCCIKLSIAKLFDSGLERVCSCPGSSRRITCAGEHVTVRVV